MKKEEKDQIINGLVKQINAYKHFYITDTANLNAADTSKLRRTCFEKEVKLVVVKNTLLKKALEQTGRDYEAIFEVLNQPTAVMFTNESSVPAKLIKEFRRKYSKPVLKAAFVEESFYIGENQLDALVAIKSKEELIGDVIMILQSPLNNVMSSLQSGKHLLAGLVKTLSERE